MLAISGVTFRTNKEITIGLSVTQTFVVLVLGAVLVRNLYFNSKFQFKQHTNVILGTLVLVNLMLIPRYTYLYGEGSCWWAAIVLEIIVRAGRGPVCTFWPSRTARFGFLRKFWQCFGH